MPTWVRPYDVDHDDRHALRYLLAGVMSVVGGLAALSGVATGGASGIAVLLVVLAVLAWTIMLWRVVLVGVWVSDHGIKIRLVLRTHVIAWPQVTRAWAGQAAHFDAWQVWVSGGDPERNVETPIWRRGSRARHRNRIVLAPEEFAAVLTALTPHR